MNSIFLLASVALLLFATSGQAYAGGGQSYAGDWRSKYKTGESLESCCGDRDCHTAASLGFPEIKPHADGSYEVRIEGYWVKYDHPSVHVSEDTNTWICYLESSEEPDALCLFFPPGVS